MNASVAPVVRITDSTLRDGSHAVRHSFTERQVRDVTSALAAAHVEVIEVSHGDGLGGSSFNYGFIGTEEDTLIRAAVEESGDAAIAILLLPGVGTLDALEQAAGLGVGVARIATHCTEADVGDQYFGAAKALGMETVGFLMLSHRSQPEELAKQARIMADAGADCVYVVDSAGSLLPQGTRDRVQALVGELGTDAQVGFHGHQNLGFGVANSLVAVESGARQIDGTLCALGAGAGNAPTEILTVVFEQSGIRTGIDPDAVLDASERVVRPLLPRVPWPDRAAISQGRYGVYSSFLLHAEAAAQRYDVPLHDLLRKIGEFGYVGGQEDMITDVALAMARPPSTPE